MVVFLGFVNIKSLKMTQILDAIAPLKNQKSLWLAESTMETKPSC